MQQEPDTPLILTRCSCGRTTITGRTDNTPADPLFSALDWCAHETARQAQIIRTAMECARIGRPFDVEAVSKILDARWSTGIARDITTAILDAKVETARLIL